MWAETGRQVTCATLLPTEDSEERWHCAEKRGEGGREGGREQGTGEGGVHKIKMAVHTQSVPVGV